MRTAARTLRGGTRASRLARWQTARIGELLAARAHVQCEEILVSTEGDRTPDRPLPEIGGKGVFTDALEARLREGAIDQARWLDERRVVLEILTGIRRAGADLVITDHAKDAARWLGA